MRDSLNLEAPYTTRYVDLNLQGLYHTKNAPCGKHAWWINSQLSPLCEKVITSVDPGGLMIDTERINSQLSPQCEKAIASVDPGGFIDDQCREDQQSTFT